MNKVIKRCSVAAGFLISLAAGSANAQVHVGATFQQQVYINEGSGFHVALEAGNSYCCELYATSTTSNAGLDGKFSMSGKSAIQGTLRGEAEPRITIVPGFTDTNAADNRACATISESGSYLLPIGSATPMEVVNVQCKNTTLRAGFNTFGTAFNFLECTNTSSSDVNAVLNGKDFSGESKISNQSITLKPGVRTDIDIHSLVGPEIFGMLTLTHDTTKESVKCFLSRYDESLTLRGSLPLE